MNVGSNPAKLIRCSIVVAVYATLVLSPQMSYAQGTPATQLLEAARDGHVNLVQQLLEQGVAPDVRDDDGRTPLHLAAANGHRQTSEMLLTHGAPINAVDDSGSTPLDSAVNGEHSGLTAFLICEDAIRGVRILRPSLEFGTIAAFQAEIGEPASLLDSEHVSFFVPTRRLTEANIVFPYLTSAYDALYQIVGMHTDFKIAVYAFPMGNPHGWGGVSNCSIEYDESNLDLNAHQEWVLHNVPHVSGYIEEMAHSFVRASQVKFGWEMTGWSIGAKVSLAVASNPVLVEQIRSTTETQAQTFADYVENGYKVPLILPYNLSDRVHAHILNQCAAEYGPSFWPDFFSEVRGEQCALASAINLGNSDEVRNRQYQIAIACFDRLADVGMSQILAEARISLMIDVNSLHPEDPSWDRRLTRATTSAADWQLYR